MQQYSRLNRPVQKPYAIGGRSDNHVPLMPLMSGQEAVDSLIGYYPTARKMDSQLNPHTYNRPTQGRSTAMPNTKLAALRKQAQQGPLLRALTGMTPTKSLFVSGFLVKCAEHRLSPEAMLVAIMAASEMHQDIAAEFEKCGFDKQAIVDWSVPGGNAFEPPKPPSVPTPSVKTPAPDATSFWSNLKSEFKNYTPFRNLWNYGAGVTNLAAGGLARAVVGAGQLGGRAYDWATGNGDSPYAAGKFFDGLAEHTDKQLQGGWNSIQAAATNSTPEAVAANNGTQSNAQLRAANTQFMNQLPNTPQNRFLGMSPSTQGRVAQTSGDLGELAGVGALTLGGGGPLVSPVTRMAKPLMGSRLGSLASKGLGAEFAGNVVEPIFNSGLDMTDPGYIPTSVNGYLQQRNLLRQQDDPAQMSSVAGPKTQAGTQQPGMSTEGGFSLSGNNPPGTQLPQQEQGPVSLSGNDQLVSDLQNLVQTNPEQAQQLAGQVTDQATNALQQNPQLASTVAGAVQGDAQAADALKAQVAQDMASQGMDQNTIMSKLQSMSMPEMIGLALGLGSAAMGLINIMSGEGGIGSWLMTILGLGGAGMLAGNAGLLGEGAQNFTQGMSNQAGNLLGGLFGAGDSGQQQLNLTPEANQSIADFGKQFNLPASGGTDPNAFDRGDVESLVSQYIRGGEGLDPAQFEQMAQFLPPELRQQLVDQIKYQTSGLTGSMMNSDQTKRRDGLVGAFAS